MGRGSLVCGTVAWGVRALVPGYPHKIVGSESMGNVQTVASAQEVPWRQAPSGELVDLGRPHRSPLGQARLQRTPKGYCAGARRSSWVRRPWYCTAR